MIDLAHDIATRQLQTLPADVRLILVHPNYLLQHVLLYEFMQEPGCLYLRLDGDKLGLEELKVRLESALNEQLTGSVLGDVKLVIVDEGDRAEAVALDTFLTALVRRNQDGRTVVLSRLVPNFVRERTPLCQQTRFIPDEPALMLPDYAQREASTRLLEVRALGSGRVMLDGRPVDVWDGTLPRSLFFFMVDRGMATRAQIFETFWPSLSSREATNVFHVTKRKISEVLGVDLTEYWSGFYHISSQIELSYDAALFAEMLQDSAVAEPDEARKQLDQAIWLYKGDFLTSIEMPWVHKRRAELLQNYGEALIGLGKMMEQANKKAEALGLYLRAAVHNRHREDLARNVMTLFYDLGIPGDALRVYKRLEAELEELLHISPDKALQEYAKKIELEMSAEKVVSRSS